jgi:hypothetical protein
MAKMNSKTILFSKKQVFRSLLFVALIQVFILVSLPIAHSYILKNSFQESKGEDFSINSSNEEKILNGKFLFKSFLGILKGFFSIGSIGVVSAAENDLENNVGCCFKLVEDGGVCSVVQESECEEGYYEGESCEDVPECEEKFCYDSSSETCSYSIESQCSEPGEFVSLSSNKCKQGCCINGDSFLWATEGRCKLSSGTWLSDINSEVGCSLLVSEGNRGACVYEDEEICKYVPEVSCYGEFHQGEYCTNFYSEETGPASTEGVCLPEINKYKVYKVDKYGNPEGVLEECNSTEKCENGACVSTSCSFKDETYLHGESWCVFDSLIGEQSILEDGGLETVSADTPGSLHYLAQCVSGEVRINPCSTLGRGSICVNNDISSGGISSDVFRQSSCELNLQGYCIASTMDYVSRVSERINEEDLEITDDDNEREVEEKQEKINEILDDEKNNLIEACGASSQCSFKETEISSQVDFPVCVGSYPTGTAACSLGTRNCTVYFVKNALGKWVAKQNEQCLTEDFVKQMNDMCVSLGDCGSSVNYIGDFSHNSDIKLENSGRLNSKLKPGEWYRSETWCDSHYVVCPEWKQGTSILEILKNRYLGFGDASDTKNKPISSLAQDYEELGEGSLAAQIFGQGFSNEQNFWGVVGGVSGGLGVLGLAATTSFLGWGAVFGASGLGSAGAGTMIFSSSAGMASLGSASFGAIAGPLAGALLGAMLGAQVAKWTGQSGGGAILYIVGFSIVGLVVALEIIGSSVPVIGNIIATALAVLTIGWALITGWGKTTTLDVQFICNEWQAPAGVSDDACSQCTDDELISSRFGFNTCTEYKCNSLGQNCEFINANSELGKRCVASEDDDTSPVLSAGNVQSGYELLTLPGKTFSLSKKSEVLEKCIPGGQNIWFEIEADEPVQCKYSFDSPENTYEMMEGNYPSDGNDYIETHKFSVEIPLLETIDVFCEEDEEGVLSCNGAEPGAESRIYIKCIDVHGNYNFGEGYKIDFCVDENLDKSPPEVLLYEPENNKEYPYNPGSINLKMYLDEQAQCKWDTESLGYGLMRNEFSSNDLKPYSKGYLQKGNLGGLILGTNKYYIKCNDSFGNIGSYVYNVKVNSDMTKEEYISKYGLKITSFSPDNEIIVTNKRPAEVLLNVKTSEGANNGKANCKYSLSGTSKYNFENTGESSHSHTLSLSSGGNYSINVLCEDLDKISSATEILRFNLTIDNIGPEIAYQYVKGRLIVETNELAKCSYSSEGCGNFEIDEGEAFDFGYDFAMNQSVDWNPAWEGYGIMCVDELENTNCVNYESDADVGPEIIRVFKEGGSLELNTDIDARCYYSYDDCSFDDETGNSMSSSYSQSHSTSWDSAVTYYIKCKDEWDNWGICLEVEPTSLEEY